jgi:hypothetical protein
MIEAIRSSETYVLARATRRHIPQDGILHLKHFVQELPNICLRRNITSVSELYGHECLRDFRNIVGPGL